MNAPFTVNEIGVATLSRTIQTQITRSVLDSVPTGIGLMRVRGKVGTLRYGNVPKLFGVKLYEGGDEVLIDIPKPLVARLDLKGGEAVVVTGTLIGVSNRYTDHRVEFHLDVVEAELQDQSQASVMDTQQQMSLERLKGLAVQRRQFPAELPVMLSLISSKSGHAQVDQDFLLELQAVSDLVKLEKIPVNVLSAQDIVDGIRKAAGQVVVLIRGGGSADQFEVFDDPTVLEALAKKDAYRVIGLGHTANTTLLDLVADYAATTPTRAGAHICQLMERTTLPLMEARRLAGEAHHAQALVLEHRTKIRLLQDRMKKRVRPMTVAAIAAAAMAAGVGVAKVFVG
jgi:exodeoxyribonuclease VII large subunit